MKLNRISKLTMVTLLLLLPAVFAFSAGQKEAGQLDVVVFVPGVSSGSPIYEMLVAGAKKAVAEVPNATLKVVEAGYNQAEWLDKLMAIAETGEFELIVSSNPSLPELCARVAQDYPEQKFFIADAYLAGNTSIHTVLYNQKEQAYMVGYLAALYTQQTSGSNIIGLVAAQSY
ncbi:MAG: BMP family ABC transporter substrate-binding protein, partial [Spirochaetes bacterium]|nr:BMP family ABC transporter substrate-binding protein [Spirochaetota bacterium]